MIKLLIKPEENLNEFKHIEFNKYSGIISVLSFDEIKTAEDFLGINRIMIKEIKDGISATKFESHDGFDFISLRLPNLKDHTREPENICIYFSENLLLFICNDSELVNDTIAKIRPTEFADVKLERIFYNFMDRITLRDREALEDIEQEVSSLEESVMTSKSENYVKEIIEHRKRLLALKRYYEQLCVVFEAIEENENNLIGDKLLRYFGMLTNRVDRLYKEVVNLRDYVTQVREAYQAQMDINLNNLMKLFTVITAIFSPLALIAGWYGMNLNMPEYAWNFGYPFVIILSMSVVIICIYWFRKNKWL